MDQFPMKPLSQRARSDSRQGKGRAAHKCGLDTSSRRVPGQAYFLGKTVVRALPVIFAIGCAALASYGAHAAPPGQIQSARFALIVVPPDADPKTNSVAAIWKDQLATLRAHVANKAVSFFNATFADGDKTIIVSVSVNDPTCENYSGALAKPTAYSSCPMRAAVLQNGTASVVASDAHFGLPIPFDANGRLDTDTGANVTTLGYNPSTHELTIAEVIDGKPATTLDDIPATKNLNY